MPRTYLDGGDPMPVGSGGSTRQQLNLVIARGAPMLEAMERFYRQVTLKAYLETLYYSSSTIN